MPKPGAAGRSDRFPGRRRPERGWTGRARRPRRILSDRQHRRTEQAAVCAYASSASERSCPGRCDRVHACFSADASHPPHGPRRDQRARLASWRSCCQAVGAHDPRSKFGDLPPLAARLAIAGHWRSFGKSTFLPMTVTPPRGSIASGKRETLQDPDRHVSRCSVHSS